MFLCRESQHLGGTEAQPAPYLLEDVDRRARLLAKVVSVRAASAKGELIAGRAATARGEAECDRKPGCNSKSSQHGGALV